MKFGICMEGLEETILNLLNTLEPPIKYVELGVAEGHTMLGVATFLKSKTDLFQVVGVDIVNGWSLKEGVVRELMENFGSHFELSLEGSQAYLLSQPDESLDFLWIDACHCYECCFKDFSIGSVKVRSGGYIGFHDSDEGCQGQDIQPICNKPIEVRKVLKDLGILDDKLEGWKLVCDIKGEQRGCVIVQKL